MSKSRLSSTVTALLFLAAGILIDHFWLNRHLAKLENSSIDHPRKEALTTGTTGTIAPQKQEKIDSVDGLNDVINETTSIDKWKRILSLIDTLSNGQIHKFSENLKLEIVSGRFSSKDVPFIFRLLGERASSAEVDAILNDEFWRKGHSLALGNLLHSWAAKQPEEALRTMKQRGGGVISETGSPLLGLFKGLWQGSHGLMKSEFDSFDQKGREQALLARALVLADEKDFVASIRSLGAFSGSPEADSLEYAYPAFSRVVLEAGPEAMKRVGDILHQMGGSLPDADLVNLSSWGSDMAKKYPDDALQWANKLAPGPARGLALNGVLLQITLQDPNRALDYLSTMQASRDEQINAVAGVESGLRLIPDVDPELIKQCKEIIRNLEK